MASPAPPTAAPVSLPAAEALASLEEARRGTLALVAHLDDGQLERVHSPIMSPLVWDLAHIAAYEDLWLAHRCAGLPLLRPDLAEVYDAFETPRAVRGHVELLGAPAAREYMDDVRARVVAATERAGLGDGLLHELVVRHELQHSETMRQTLALAGLLPPGEPALRPLGGEEGWVELPAGTFLMGAGAEGFAYDNERPRHVARTGAFRIARRPVTRASWLRFTEDSGYERREWWSPEGWAWREEHDVTGPASVPADGVGGVERAGGAGGVPICHVSWFEADAFARAHGARLPTEAEWERAAAEPGLEGVGQVWEWTASPFYGYPGFVAHPYREYSEVFFGGDYRVLRGGSWATHARVATRTFRNWDHPLRRQLFAGVRLARDVA
jgi:iron(II)-dependent oxidoreductase